MTTSVNHGNSNTSILFSNFDIEVEVKDVPIYTASIPTFVHPISTASLLSTQADGKTDATDYKPLVNGLISPPLEIDPQTRAGDVNDYIFIFHSLKEEQEGIQRALKNASIDASSISGKHIVIIDNFFTSKEGNEMRRSTEFLDHSVPYPTNDISVSRGEDPPKSLTLNDRLGVFLTKPGCIAKIYQLFAHLGDQMQAVVSSHRWHFGKSGNFTTNFLTRASEQTEKFGYDQDYEPETGSICSFPKVYSKENHARTYVNGSQGNPYLLSVILYMAAQNFNPDWGMGTNFKESDGKIRAIRCQHMRLVLFEGDIEHGIQRSRIPEGLTTWRVSYVWKICFRPRTADAPALNERFAKLFA